MASACIHCNRRKDNLINIRDKSLEPAILAENQDLLALNSDQALPVCAECVNYFKNKYNMINPGDIENEMQHVSPDSSMSLAEDSGSIHSSSSSSHNERTPNQNLQVVTESLARDGSGTSQNVASQNVEVNLARIQEVNVREQVEDLMKRPMPLAVRKRRLEELNVEAEFVDDDAEQNIDEILDRRAKQLQDEARRKRRNLKRVMVGRSNSQRSHISSQSSLSSREELRSFSQPIRSLTSNGENRVTPGRAIQQRSPPIDTPLHPPQQRNTTSRNVVDVPDIDDSSFSSNEAVRNASNEREVPQSDTTRPRPQRKRRDQDDGNAHSNSAAPRRVNFTTPQTGSNSVVNPTRANSKDVSGG